MVKVTTTPGSRFGWKGAEVEYLVKADGASDLRLPEQDCPGVETRLVDVKRTADGMEGRIRLLVRDSTYV